jgi:hypothetical protein
VNARQASLLRGRLSACLPGTPVDVTPDGDGARIFIEHADGYHVRVTTGDKPGMVLRALLSRDLRMVGGEAGDGTA